MPKAVIENWSQFEAYLADQPLCQWSAKKQREVAAGLHSNQGHASIHAPPKKNDNADLAAALASMA
jgi:hypothetical protein